MQAGSGSCKCVTVTQDMGDLHNFPSMHIASPFQTCPRFVLCSLDQAFKTWEPSCLCQFSGACLLAKTVACDGAREVRSCLWPDAASVEVAAGSHTTTLPHCQGRPRWGRPPRSVLGSGQLLLTLGGARARCSRPATSPMESGALAFRQGRALSAHYSGVDQVARADVGAGDLGSFNKSPPPTQ